MSDLLIRNCRPLDLAGATSGEAVDIRIRDGLVAEIGANLSGNTEREVRAEGRWAIPGLWDRHVHLDQWALTTRRLDLSGTHSAAEVCARVAAADHGSTIQGYGHRTATWAEQPTVAELDAVTGEVPAVLISGDAHHGWLNSAALAALGIPAREGIIEEAEWFDLYPRLSELPGVGVVADQAVRETLTAAVRRGIVGMVDLEFAPNHERWAARMADPAWAGTPMPRIEAGVYPVDLAAAIDAGLRTGSTLGSGLVRLGPLKVISDGSLSTRTAFCCEPYADAVELPMPYGVANVEPAELTELVATASTHGFHCAVHAIGDAAVRDAVRTFAAVGATGSIEHAQLVNDAEISAMATLSLVASVQPAHLLDDIDAMEQCWPDRVTHCFRLRTMLEAGVDVRLGSDAPVARLDPWWTMAAAVHRGLPTADAWHAEEAISVAQALRCSTNGIDRLDVGGPGDIVLLDENPLAWQGNPSSLAGRLGTMRVAVTVVAGHPWQLS